MPPIQDTSFSLEEHFRSDRAFAKMLFVHASIDAMKLSLVLLIASAAAHSEPVVTIVPSQSDIALVESQESRLSYGGLPPGLPSPQMVGGQR